MTHPQPLLATLTAALSKHPRGALCVAFSGGPDSAALLHALAHIDAARARGLRAIHVDHGLATKSHAWAQHCATFCGELGIALQVCQVQVVKHSHGLEAAARAARYATFTENLTQGEALVTAHHQDDQAETVLLKLLRGAGPEGLGGMRERRPCGAGWLWRPLLDTPRAVLRQYLHDQELASITDPSNASTQHARNFLRLNILPQLQTRWPRVVDTLSASAQMQQQASDYIRQQASNALASLLRKNDPSIDAAGWLALSPALQAPALELWLHGLRLPSPGQPHCAQLRSQIPNARDGRVAEVRWPGAVVHLWRGRLYATAPRPPPAPWHGRWTGGTLQLPGDCGTLAWTPQPDSPPSLEVRLGETGVRLRPASDAHTRSLRDLFQRAAIPPWERPRYPLVYAMDGTLLAVADRWFTQPGRELCDRLATYLVWARQS